MLEACGDVRLLAWIAEDMGRVAPWPMVIYCGGISRSGTGIPPAKKSREAYLFSGREFGTKPIFLFPVPDPPLGINPAGRWAVSAVPM